ncbi:type III secretion system chaperone [Edwardsiella ictaluri]|uniref:type III secretion system chaperone n=1 Tax=Edwardsiella ictaluri TaxID=67780 RepID=UPI0012DDBC25|nr:type III secretion system chaperone [Edwardsiella ictaluri]
MDIFEESLSPLGVSVVFDENNLFSCEINQESTEGRGRAPWQLTVYRDQDDISLAISIVLGTPLPDNPTPDFITLLGEQAIEPLRGGVGIGIYPGTSQLAVYQRVQLSGKPTGIVIEAIKSLFAIAEEWESLLSPERQKPPSNTPPPRISKGIFTGSSRDRASGHR